MNTVFRIEHSSNWILSSRHSLWLLLTCSPTCQDGLSRLDATFQTLTPRYAALYYVERTPLIFLGRTHSIFLPRTRGVSESLKVVSLIPKALV